LTKAALKETNEGDNVTEPIKKIVLIDQFVELIPPTCTMQQKGHTVINGTVRTYTKSKIKAMMEMYRAYFNCYGLREPVKDKPLHVIVEIYWPPPKYMAQHMDIKKRVYKTTKPDADNAVKLFMDSVGDLFFDDDSRIVRLEVVKYFCRTSGVYFKLMVLD
jgi:Holliday junction resolvase RusA-like endonuclease